MAEFNDGLSGLVNKVTGQGTSRDKLLAQSWYYAEPQPTQLQNSYRANWVCRKVIDAPVMDLMREGWTWQLEEDDNTKVKAAQKRFGVAAKIAWAKRMANLYGGAAILIGDGSPNPEEPLDLSAIGRGGLKYLTALTRYEITSGQVQHDMLDPDYRKPKDYMLSGRASTAKVHPSRIVRFTGRDSALIGMPVQDVWGDSILAGVLREIAGYATGVNSTARLLEESTVNYFKIKGYLDKLATPGGEQAIAKALDLLQQQKSAINAVVMDVEDGNMEQFTADFNGLPDVVRSLLQLVAGAADMPLTRLLGTSPGGLNATGESDVRNYYDRLKSEQAEDIAPALDRIGEAVIRSELGTMPDGAEYDFNPLWQMTEKEQAEVDGQNASTISTLGAAGQVPGAVLQRVTRAVLTESPTFSAAKSAYDEADADGSIDDLDEATDEEVDAANRIGDASFSDGTPRPLYVRRNVLNGAAIVKWAKKQGFKTTLPAGDMHVTLAFSRKPLDWHKAGAAWEDTIDVPAGGPRTVERFGMNAIVLEIASNNLKYRHQALKRAGAISEFEEYRPHITITYNPGTVDLEKVTPYQGKILLGHEIFEPIKEDWKSTIQEDAQG